MNKLKIKVILGSTRPTRFGERPAKWITEKARSIEDFDVELLDLRDYPMPFFEEPMGPSSPEFKIPNEIIQNWTDKIAEADGFIIVTPEYNHGYPAVLKNAIDYVYHEWAHKPVAFVSYGTVGGTRAVQQLRQVIIELNMASIKHSVLIPEPWMIPEDDNKFEKYNTSADSTLEQLHWWTKTLKAGRDQ